MKKIEYNDAEKATSEKNQVLRFSEILTANLNSLKKFNKVTRLIDETNVFEVTVAERDPEARNELLRIVGDAVPFGGLTAARERVDEILDILTTTDMKRRRSQYPRFGNIAPLKSVAPPIIDGKKLRGSDFVIRNDKVVATNDILTGIENANLYRVENDVQEKVYTLSTAIARNFQELAAVYAKHGKVLNREVFMGQLFCLSGDVADYRQDEKNIFVSILPLFK